MTMVWRLNSPMRTSKTSRINPRVLPAAGPAAVLPAGPAPAFPPKCRLCWTPGAMRPSSRATRKLTTPSTRLWPSWSAPKRMLRASSRSSRSRSRWTSGRAWTTLRCMPSCVGTRAVSARSNTALCRIPPPRTGWRSPRPRPSWPPTRPGRSRTCAPRGSFRRRMRRLRSPRITWRSSSLWSSGRRNTTCPWRSSRPPYSSGRRNSRRPWTSSMPTWTSPKPSSPVLFPTAHLR